MNLVRLLFLLTAPLLLTGCGEQETGISELGMNSLSAESCTYNPADRTVSVTLDLLGQAEGQQTLVAELSLINRAGEAMRTAKKEVPVEGTFEERVDLVIEDVMPAVWGRSAKECSYGAN